MQRAHTEDQRYSAAQPEVFPETFVQHTLPASHGPGFASADPYPMGLLENPIFDDVSSYEPPYLSHFFQPAMFDDTRGICYISLGVRSQYSYPHKIPINYL